MGKRLGENFTRATANNLNFRFGITFDGQQQRINEGYVGSETCAQFTNVCFAWCKTLGGGGIIVGVCAGLALIFDLFSFA